MTEKELVAQFLNREVSNILAQINPVLRMFSPAVSNYLYNVIEPYISLFIPAGETNVNLQAAGEYIKTETNQKIEEFMKKFEQERNGL